MTFWKWSRTAATNGSADSTCPFPEGMAPSALNDGARGVMAAAAKYRDDMAGAIVTTGTSTAYAVSSYQGFDTLAHLDGGVIAFTPHTTNGDTVVLSVDGLASKPLRPAPGVELVAGTLVQGTPYMALYNNTDGVFYLRGYHSSPFNVPFLGGMDFWDTIAPNSCFIFPAGQAISRTVYSRAFSRWGTTYGVGDGSTTFNVPDKTGRVSAMKEAAAARLTVAGSGINGAAMGAANGLTESKTLATANLPAYTPTGTIANGAITFPNAKNTSAANGSQGAIATGNVGANGDFTSLLNPAQGTSTFTGNAQGGSSTPFSVVQPTIVCNYIIRII